MNIIDKISKEMKTLIDSTKDVINKNLADSVSSGSIKIDKSQLEKLLQIIDASVDDSYQRSINFFQRSLSKHLDSEKTSKK